MKIHLANADTQLEGSENVLLEASRDVTLSIHLDVDEALGEASVWLGRSTLVPPTSTLAPTTTTTTDKGTDLRGITWVCVDWRTTHTLTQLRLDAITANTNVRVRLQVARGAGSWYSPPGPHTFMVPRGKTSLIASLPDTVADRVMVEFLADDAVTQPVTLGTPPVPRFGHHARDVSLAVQGRQVSALPGESTENVELSGLLEALHERGFALVGPRVISLELRAAAAGWIRLAWSFVATVICTRFLGPPAGESISLALPFDGEAELPLLRHNGARIESLELSMSDAPKRERLIVPSEAPDPSRSAGSTSRSSMGEALGELVRPGSLSAQRFDLLEPAQLTGASIWARPLATRVRVVASLLADRSGTPGQARTSVTLELDTPDYVRAGPRWIELDFAEPVDCSAGPLWLALGCEVGELSWIVGEPVPAGLGALRQCRRSGAWLTREPQDWALLRIRAAATGELTAPRICLALDSTKHELVAESKGHFRWTASASEPLTASKVALHIHTTMPTTLKFDQLRLRWRPT